MGGGWEDAMLTILGITDETLTYSRFYVTGMSQPQQQHKLLRSQKGVKSRGWFGGKVLVLMNGTICCLFDISCTLQNNFLANFIFLPLILRSKVSETDNR